MSKIGYLRIRTSKGAVMKNRFPGGHVSNNPPLFDPVIQRPSITILMGEKARCVNEAAHICRGKYPVTCQWHHRGNVDAYDRIQSEGELRFLYAVPHTWDRSQYLIIRRA